MIAFKRVVTVKDPGRVILSWLPFQPGQRVEIVMIADGRQPCPRAKEIRKLLRATQRLPAATAVTGRQIADEIAAYRSGR
jgi:hypothetical protein